MIHSHYDLESQYVLVKHDEDYIKHFESWSTVERSKV